MQGLVVEPSHNGEGRAAVGQKACAAARMAMKLDQGIYRDKVYACWLGKNIGGTLGTPYEGRKYVNDLTFYDPVPTKPLPNDDLDLQLIWLKMLEDKGLPPRLPYFAEYWQRYAHAYPWNEYGFCTRNLVRGLRPPVSGWFENYYVDEMGSPIRSELWACLAPANPQRAAALAWLDSAMDHAGGEGMWGEMFWAAVESAAFVIQDPLTLIRIGLAMIPPSCSIARAIREAVWHWQNGSRWAAARDRIVTIYGHVQPCNAIQNHAFTVLGWLYGKDFGDKLCKAVNCGYDTDCTGATLGALLGILDGTAGIPEEWSRPVGKEIVLHKFTGHFDAPADIEELTDRTVALARQYADENGVILGEGNTIPDNILSLLFRNEEALAAAQRDIRAAVAADRDLDISLHYHGEPVLYPGVARFLSVSASRHGKPVPVEVELKGPADWHIKPEGDGFLVLADSVPDRNTLQVRLKTDDTVYAAEFTILGPGEAKGYPSGLNVPICPTCRGTQGMCICSE